MEPPSFYLVLSQNMEGIEGFFLHCCSSLLKDVLIVVRTKVFTVLRLCKKDRLEMKQVNR